MIYITGKNGQLGIELKKQAAFKAATFLDHSELDLSNLDAVESFLRNKKIKCLINTAAYTQVDKAEVELDIASKINCEAPGLMARYAREKKFKFIHYSTDYVFNGKSTQPYVESDITNPVNAYGKSKLDGEKLILSQNPEALVLRTSWLYSSAGKNFVKTILRLCSEKPSLNVVYDQIGTPTSANDLANITNLAMNADISGIFHFSNEGVTSWYDFALMILQKSSLKSKIHPILSENYPTPAARPNFSVLNKNKLKCALNITINHWSESLDIVMKDLNEQN